MIKKGKSSLSRGVYGKRRLARSARSSRTGVSRWRDEGAAEPLTRSQVRELRRRIADLEDPFRYLIVAGFGPRFTLYYNVSENMYAMNNPSGGTLFKQRSAALAVKRLLGSTARIIRCTTRRRHGVRVPVLPATSPRSKTRAQSKKPAKPGSR